MTATRLAGWDEGFAGLRTRVIGGYRLTFMEPSGEQPAEGWPLLLALDADQHGLTLMETARRLGRRPEKTGVQPLLVVGVQRDTPDRAHRFRDFTAGPSASGDGPADVPTGGANAFADVLLGPALDAIRDTGMCNAQPPAVWGHSLSAWFALWLAATRPGALSAVAAISPSLWWDEAPLAPLADTAPPIFLAAGERETDAPGRTRRMIPRATALTARVQSPSRLHLFPDEDHASIVSASAAAALRSISGSVTDQAAGSR